MSAGDTIYALASGFGTVALSVIRISGSKSQVVLEAMAGSTGVERRCHLRVLRDPLTGEMLDQAITVWIPGPGSFTGEDCAELHIHGGRAVQSGILKALSQIPGLRLAEPGEFTRRAVANNKIDLVEAEGLGEVLAARTSRQRRQALAQMRGESSGVFDSWREQLLLIRAEIEAAVDFADEDGVAEEAKRSVDRRIGALRSEMVEAERQSASAAVIRNGVKVVLAGLPNTGKSSLLNALVRREAAIVSAVPGTTRDVIEVFLDLDGVPVLLTDTAGLREDVADAVEAEGVRRSRVRLDEADIVVWVASADVPGSEEYDQQVEPDIFVEGKSDTAESKSGLLRNDQSIHIWLSLSAATGQGVDLFVRRLTDLARERYCLEESPVIVTERQRQITAESIRVLNSALAHHHDALELKAEDVRVATDAIGRLTGRVDVEEWLGEIFSRFCIGK